MKSTPRTITNTLAFVLMAGMLAGAIPASAEISVSAEAEVQTPRPLPALFRKDIDREVFEDIKEGRIEARVDIQNTRGEIHDIRIDAQADGEAIRAEVKSLLDSAESKEEKREILENAREDIKENRLEARGLTAEKKAEIQNSVRYMFIKSFTLMNARLEKVFAGVEARIEVLAEAGVDVSASKTFVENAQVNLESFVDISSEMKSLLDSKPESKEEAEKVKAELRALAEQAKEALKSAHENLKGAIQALKESTSEQEVEVGVETEA